MTSVEVHDAAAREGIDAAKRAVWADPGWDAGIAHCQTMIGLHDVPRGATVVDVGCGVGRLLVPYAREMPNVLFFGIDPSPSMRAHAKAAIDDGAIPNAVILNVTDGLAALKDEAVDVAYSVLVFQHLEAKELLATLRTVRRALKPGKALRFQFVHEADPGPLSHPVTVREMAALLASAGFTVANFEPDPIFPSWTWCTARTEPT